MIHATAAEVLHQYLTDQGLIQNTNQASNWWAVVGKKVTSPTNAVFLYDTTGVIDGRTRDGHIVHHGVQVMLRAQPYRTGQSKIKTILEVLQTVQNVEVTVAGEPVIFCAFHLSSAINHLGQETDKVAELFSLNGTVTLQEPSS